MSQLKERLESLLQEDNFVTQQLVKLEEKTGVRRELLAIGRSRSLLRQTPVHDCNWQPGWVSYLSTPVLPLLFGQSSPRYRLNALTSQ